MGFPPYRSGGLTKFCMDLMKEQISEGHEVSLLWPGEMKLAGSTVSIKKGAPSGLIDSYEVINPLPVSYDEGIKDIDAFMYEGDAAVYGEFLDGLKPDIIHVHTLMGLHRSFLKAANEKGIRLVFTTHDFFPICPKVTMYRHGKVCASADTCEECGVCNNTALSLKKIRILQSPLYRAAKDSPVVKKLRKHHRDEYLGDDSDRDGNGSAGTAEDFKKLRKNYQEMLSLMDVIHYNSTVTKSVYEKYLKMPAGTVIPITHADIADHRTSKDFSGDTLRIRYLGAQSGAKGYPVLKKAMDILWEERQDFVLDVHFEPVEKAPYIRSHDRFGYTDLEKIFGETDVLIAPSIWYETFGFTVLEALSFGVPVIISGNVGAKDILAEGAGIIIDDIDENKIADAVRNLGRQKLTEMNSVITGQQNIITIKQMSEQITDECYAEGR